MSIKCFAATLLLLLFIFILPRFLLSGREKRRPDAPVLIKGPEVVLAGTPFSMEIVSPDAEGRQDHDGDESLRIRGVYVLEQKGLIPFPADQKLVGGHGIYHHIVI